jgi:hypothetical protein
VTNIVFRFNSPFIILYKQNVFYIYSFPDPKKYPEMYGKWLENVNRNARIKFVQTRGSRLCSEHFSSEMKEEGGQRVILKLFAVPKIFPTSKVCASFLYHFLI